MAHKRKTGTPENAAGNRVIFITGGARSGKSSFALREAVKVRGKRAYIATAEACDREMDERIMNHKRERGRAFVTYEEPLRIAGTILRIKHSYRVILVDCLTLWLSNILLRKRDADREIDKFVEALRSFKSDPLSGRTGKGCSLYLVSNEVGMGIVPDNKLARRFRDAAGLLHQRIAAGADEVYLLVAGIPVRIK